MLPIVGGDDQSKALAPDLMGRLGFGTVDAGRLAESWRFERDTIVCLAFYAATTLTSLEMARLRIATPRRGDEDPTCTTFPPRTTTRCYPS
ncbi:hypothetical protein [Wenjunlia tyrosinilytica]|uniref:hypothetical protein n=1 Tax=Wenjunlia tyrosinilytica TaxID=1544741 RepID=UPI001666A5B4|nr:hypothetical protein [Wenjunlia tyrosinilytica]